MIPFIPLVGLAAEPLVHDGDEAVAVERTAAATARPATDFTPKTASDLAAGPVALVPAAGVLLVCDGGPVSREQLLLGVQGAEGALAYGEDDKAREELARIATADRCPPDGFDRELLVRWLVARGRTGDADAWRFVRALDPSVSFSDEWLPDLRPAFDAAAPAGEVVLRIPQPGISIDGAAAAGEVRLVPGWHALVAPGIRAGLVLDGASTLVVPSALPSDWLGPVADPDTRTVPTAALAAAFGEGTRVFVSTDAGTWAATAGRTDWIELTRYRSRRIVPAGFAVAGVGLLSAAVTGVVAATTYGDVASAANEVETAPTVQAFQQARQDYDEARSRYLGFRWLPAAGGGIAGLGVGLAVVGIAAGPVPVGR